MLTYVLCSIYSVVNWLFKTGITWLVALGGKVDHGYINFAKLKSCSRNMGQIRFSQFFIYNDPRQRIRRIYSASLRLWTNDFIFLYSASRKMDFSVFFCLYTIQITVQKILLFCICPSSKICSQKTVLKKYIGDAFLPQPQVTPLLGSYIRNADSMGWVFAPMSAEGCRC